MHEGAAVLAPLCALYRLMATFNHNSPSLNHNSLRLTRTVSLTHNSLSLNHNSLDYVSPAAAGR